MPNILELRRRAKEINVKAQAAMKACESGVITTKQFGATIDELKAEDTEVAAQFKAYNEALRWAGGSSDSGDPPRGSQFVGNSVPADVRCKAFTAKMARGFSDEDAGRQRHDAVKARSVPPVQPWSHQAFSSADPAYPHRWRPTSPFGQQLVVIPEKLPHSAHRRTELRDPATQFDHWDARDCGR